MIRPTGSSHSAFSTWSRSSGCAFGFKFSRFQCLRKMFSLTSLLTAHELSRRRCVLHSVADDSLRHRLFFLHVRNPQTSVALALLAADLTLRFRDLHTIRFHLASKYFTRLFVQTFAFIMLSLASSRFPFGGAEGFITAHTSIPLRRT